MSILSACESALAAASHVDRDGADAGAVAALFALARKIDAWDEIVELAMDQAPEGRRPTVPQHDNTSLPTFLRYCEALGLTPGSRRALTGDKVVEVDPVDELKKRREAKRATG